MTTEQKIEILEAIIYELSEFIDKYGNVPEDFSIHESRLQSLLEAIEQEQPEPLDPHTCDLCVGDVVLFYNKELVVQRIEGEKIYAASSISVHEYSRDEITLKSNQRAGVQIETE